MLCTLHPEASVPVQLLRITASNLDWY